MSTKINLTEIISGHISTLHDAATKKVSKTDIIVFYGLPTIIAILLLISNFSLTDNITTLLINFSAIFTALLLSVLVLVYDQGEKLKQKEAQTDMASSISLKKELLAQLYYNICYSVVISVSMIIFCLAETLMRGKQLSVPIKDSIFAIEPSSMLLTPLIVFLTVNLLLTILMVVKRMHTLLTA